MMRTEKEKCDEIKRILLMLKHADNYGPEEAVCDIIKFNGIEVTDEIESAVNMGAVIGAEYRRYNESA